MERLSVSPSVIKTAAMPFVTGYQQRVRPASWGGADDRLNARLWAGRKGDEAMAHMQLDGEPWAQTIPVNAAQPLLVRPAQQAYGLFALASAAERVGAGRALLAGPWRLPLSAACRCARLCTLGMPAHPAARSVVP